MDHSFLLLAAKAATDPAFGQPLRTFGRPIDVPSLLAAAARHRLGTFAVASLLHLPSGAIDEQTRRDLHERLLTTTTSNLIALSSALGQLEDLAEQGIEAAIAATPQVELLLAGVDGYELSLASPLVTALQHRSRTIDVGVGNRRIRALAEDERLLALTADAAANGYRLDWLVGAALLARGPLDWPSISRTAARTDLEQPLGVLMLLVRDVIGIETPPATAASQQHRRSAAALTERLLTDLRDRPKPVLGVRPGHSRELWIAGFPSPYGGADTELDHQIDLLRAHDVAVHLVPMFGADDTTRTSVVERGCQIHEFEPRIFRDKIVASFCNGEFLNALPAIVERGRPARIIWFNCMTWLFDKELDAHRHAWIDLFGFQSRYQRHILEPQLEQIRPVRTFPYRPYFNARRVGWHYRDWNGTYSLGRISRDDATKFADDTWEIFDRVRTPKDVKKKICVLGYGPNAERKIGAASPTLDCTILAPGQISATAFYRSIDTMIHKTGGSRENYSRVLIEAYAHGVVPIVERDFGFPELVVHAETGFMTSDSCQMSDYASLLAADPARHRRMAESGRRYLEGCLGNPDACWGGWKEALS